MRTCLPALPLLAALALATATIEPGCTPAIAVHTIAFPAADSAEHQTFAFGAPEDTPSEYQASAGSAEVRRRVALIVTDFLQKKGYVQKPDGEPDFIVRIASGRRERKELRSVILPHPMPTRPAWFEEHEEEDFVEGILVIDLLDGQNQPLWHGAASVEINPEKIDDQLLKRATSKVLALFPWPRAQRAGP